MDRRLFLKKSCLTLSTSFITFQFLEDAHAAVCVTTDHLDGAVPTTANAAVSSTGQFRHHHYLHVPIEILTTPPKAGWSTISSMMIPELGIGEFFFIKKEVRKQFHCHQVFFSQKQLMNIAKGVETEVIAYIAGFSGPVKNHTFLFNNKTETFLQHSARLQKDAIDNELKDKLKLTKSVCDTKLHGGVTVFNSSGTTTVTDVTKLEALKGY